MDTDAYPSNRANGQECTDLRATPPSYTPTTCLVAQDLQNELVSYIAAHHYPTGVNVEYFVFTPPGVGDCFDSTSAGCFNNGYCAWHDYAATGSTVITLANMPYAPGTDCDTLNTLAGIFLNNDGTDSEVDSFSHELAETMTDPLINAWQGPGGDEVGDKCSYQYVVGDPNYFDRPWSLPTQNNDGTDYYNTTLAGRNYLLQMEFDNSANGGAGGCNQWDTDTQPTATIAAPAHPASGVPASFSLTGVSDPAGIAYVTWSFGDGTTAVSSGTAGIQHSFSGGGDYTVTAIVTDNHGNEVRETAPVTVTQSPASLTISLSTTHPAPGGSYRVKLTGQALTGGVFGASHNRSEVDLFEQALSPACASTRSAEVTRVTAGKAKKLDSWLVAAGAFAVNQGAHALPGQHQSIRLCGYLSQTPRLTNAKATTSYTTT